jgi:hypothetical protein
MHKLLESYYLQRKEGKNVFESRDKAIWEGRSYAIETDLDAEYLEFELGIFRQYVEHYASEAWTPIEVEQPFFKVIYEREDEFFTDDDGAPQLRTEGLTVLVEGRIDLMIKNLNDPLPIIVDHKTIEKDSMIWGITNQYKCYCWALGLNNIVINKIGFQKKDPDNGRFNRPSLSYSKEQIDEWVEDTKFWAGLLDTFLTTGYWPHKYASCHHFGGCPFRKVCDTTPDNREYVLSRDFKRREFDLLKSLEGPESGAYTQVSEDAPGEESD